MADLHKITDFSISTTMTNPLRGIVEIETPESAIKFELSEEVARSNCVARHTGRALQQCEQQQMPDCHHVIP